MVFRRHARQHRWPEPDIQPEAPLDAALQELVDAGRIDRCGAVSIAGRSLGVPSTAVAAAAIQVAQACRAVRDGSFFDLVDVALVNCRGATRPAANKAPIHRYRFALQDTDVRADDDLRSIGGDKFRRARGPARSRHRCLGRIGRAKWQHLIDRRDRSLPGRLGRFWLVCYGRPPNNASLSDSLYQNSGEPGLGQGYRFSARANIVPNL
jgi:hypothetical protein